MNYLFEYVKYLGEAFKFGFMGNLEGEDGIKKNFEKFKVAWGKAFKSLETMTFGPFAGEMGPYTGLAGIAEFVGDLFGTIINFLIKVGTGIAKLISDPQETIGTLRGMISGMFMKVGMTLSNFFDSVFTLDNLLKILENFGLGAFIGEDFKKAASEKESKRLKKKQQELDADILAQEDTIKIQTKHLQDLKTRKKTDKNLTEAQTEVLNTEIGNTAKAIEIANQRKDFQIEESETILGQRKAAAHRQAAIEAEIQVEEEFKTEIGDLDVIKKDAKEDIEQLTSMKQMGAGGIDITTGNRMQLFATGGAISTAMGGDLAPEKAQLLEDGKFKVLYDDLESATKFFTKTVAESADVIKDEGWIMGDSFEVKQGSKTDLMLERLDIDVDDLPEILERLAKANAIVDESMSTIQKLELDPVYVEASKRRADLTKTIEKGLIENFDQGGVVDYTGLAMVHGGDGKPEVMFDNIQMNRLEALLTLGERDRGGGGSNDFSTQNVDSRRITSTVTNIAAPQRHLFGVQEQRFGVA